MEQRKVCENCLHWGNVGTEYKPDGGIWGRCILSTPAGANGYRPGASAVAVALDATPGTLVTAPAHSCNQWEQAEA